jgi:hypothetical protein
MYGMVTQVTKKQDQNRQWVRIKPILIQSSCIDGTVKNCTNSQTDDSHIITTHLTKKFQSQAPRPVAARDVPRQAGMHRAKNGGPVCVTAEENQPDGGQGSQHSILRLVHETP